MELVQLLSMPRTCFLPTNNNLVSPKRKARCNIYRPTLCSASSQVPIPTEADGRRSAHYQPTVWSYSFLQSLKPNYTDETQAQRAIALEREVRYAMHYADAEPSTLLLLIDDVQRLGLRHRFEEDIGRALDRYISQGGCKANKDRTLYTTSLGFRLLRQHGYEVSQDIFESFMDRSQGKFFDNLGNDIKGLLSLYEASQLAFEGEEILEEAMEFAIEHLRGFKSVNIGKNLQDQVVHSLDLPLHRRMQWQDACWHIESYRTRKDMNYGLLELAVLNFNTVQSILQEDLQHMSRWWNNNIGLGNKLVFARDRLMECFFWTVGMAFDPQFSSCRRGLTRVTSLITTIDDVYDVYGTLDELELFTDAVERWNVNAMSNLPDYMKLCFLALYNTVHEMAYEFLKKQGENIIPYLTKAWADLCKTFLQEAKWSHNKITPTFDEYLNNGWVSVSGVLILVHAYFLCGPSITKEALCSLEKFHDLVRWPSTIFRLCNDLATSSAELERGETANSILCYMLETGASEELARCHINKLIDLAWKKMNSSLVGGSVFGKSFVDMAYNLARISHYTYQNGDSHGAPDNRSKEQLHSLLIDPISIT
ncbi:probable terpene synthase 12 [Punica granatum]|uniref:Probable terpene synthase 12 n=1 Tax=Punica granatum TaxID=22663 RepID=A0A6P8CD31_PUNGR|nr:probable terpene synthase 12 [Punica granatum]